MSKSILIMGESGGGKTTSLRNLDPATTYIIDCDGKGLNWKGWKEQYSVQKKNYFATDYPQLVTKALYALNGQDLDKDGTPKPSDKFKEFLKFKVVVIDTINALMVAQEGRERLTKGYDKWADLAWNIYDILNLSLKLRDDLTIILMAHCQTDRTEDGYMWTRVKTNGRKLDKIVPESKLNTVILARKDEDGYHFVIKDANSTVKVPMGAFGEETVIDNDITKVIKALEDF